MTSKGLTPNSLAGGPCRRVSFRAQPMAIIPVQTIPEQTIPAQITAVQTSQR